MGQTRLALIVLGGMLGLWLAAVAVVLGSGGLPPDSSGRMVVVFPPGTSADDALLRVAAADGRIVRQSWFPFAVVAFDDGPDFAGRLRAVGAMATIREMLAAFLLAGGCVGGHVVLPPPRIGSAM